MNFFVQHSELRDLYEKVTVAIVLILASFFCGCDQAGKTSRHVYYFHNGIVYIEEKNPGGADKTYWHDSDGTSQETTKNPCYNGLTFWPAIYEKIPGTADPFKWKPKKSQAVLALKTFLKDYDATVLHTNFIPMDIALRAGETKDTAFARIVDELAGRYCSYEEQAIASKK